MNPQLLFVTLIISIAWSSAYNLRAAEEPPTEETGVCNKCQLNRVACINEKEFMICSNGDKPDAEIYNCHGDLVCTTLPQVCSRRDVKLPTCVEKCGLCDKTHKFACINRNTYALCLGTETFSNITGVCGSGEICNVDEYDNSQKSICTKECVVSPSCESQIPIDPPTTTTTTSIPEVTPAPESADSFCADKTISGFYRSKMNCRHYYYCEISNGKVTMAVQMDCDAEEHFDLDLEECAPGVPDECKPSTPSQP